jgi:hypothetical protein
MEILNQKDEFFFQQEEKKKKKEKEKEDIESIPKPLEVTSLNLEPKQERLNGPQDQRRHFEPPRSQEFLQSTKAKEGLQEEALRQPAERKN